MPRGGGCDGVGISYGVAAGAGDVMAAENRLAGNMRADRAGGSEDEDLHDLGPMNESISATLGARATDTVFQLFQV